MTTNGRMIALALGGLLGMSGGLPAVGGMEKAPIPVRAPAMRPSRKFTGPNDLAKPPGAALCDRSA